MQEYRYLDTFLTIQGIAHIMDIQGIAHPYQNVISRILFNLSVRRTLEKLRVCTETQIAAAAKTLIVTW